MAFFWNIYIFFSSIIDNEECDADHHNHKSQAREENSWYPELVLRERAVRESLIIEKARKDIHHKCRPSRANKAKNLYKSKTN